MQAARDRQKSYADLKRKPMEFQVRDKVMLKVLPWKGFVRFGKRGKLNPRVHSTFYVSNLKNCHADEPFAVPLDGLHFDDKLHFFEKLVEIVDREVKRLKRSQIPLVKFRWNSKRVQTPGSGISILLAVGTPSTGSGNLYCQWELSPGKGNALCILFPPWSFSRALRSIYYEVMPPDTYSVQAPFGAVTSKAWSLIVVRPLAISSPPASPLSPWSSPPPQIPFPPLPLILSPPSPVLSPAPPPSPIHAPSSGTPLLLPISASTSSPPLLLPSASRREDRPEVTLPPRKRLGIALGPRYEVGESSSAAAARPARGLKADYGFVAAMDREIMRDLEREVGYGITDSWDEIVETLQGAPVSTDTELGGYMRKFEMRVRQDTDEIYMRLDDEQTERQLLADASDLVRGEVMSLCTTVLGQMTEIRELHAADRRRQTMISKMLRVDHRRSIKIIELRTALQGQGLAGGPTQPELPEEAGSGS
nr:putative reverse transcriptase domain-containing protein [Tanacetum cinerariifolium]